MNQILFLASWYSSRVNPFTGDFIERHAQCISLTNKVYVVFVVKDPSIKDGKPIIEKKVSENLVTYKAYYPSKGKSIFLEKIYSNLYFWKLHRRIFKNIIDEFGTPNMVHLNVMMKAGLFALWLKKKYKLPYVLSENWTGYYPERKDGFRQQPFWYKYLSKKIYQNCDYPLPVTEDLGKVMNSLFGEKKFAVIPNVVDTTVFFDSAKLNQDKIKFIHPSTLGYHKNIEGILNTIEKLYKKRKDFEVHLLGNATEELIAWTKERDLENSCVFFTGLIPYNQVAEKMRESDVLIMFSRYENLPCVILEALCCGLPVISSDVGGIREVLNPENGILIPSENEEELLNAMEYMIDNLYRFDKKKIASSAQKKFNFDTVGKQFDKIYKKLKKN